jgi:hypothetical protein
VVAVTGCACGLVMQVLLPELEVWVGPRMGGKFIRPGRSRRTESHCKPNPVSTYVNVRCLP